MEGLSLFRDTDTTVRKMMMEEEEKTNSAMKKASNDCASDHNTNILWSLNSDPVSIEIQAIFEHQVLNGVEYYLVLWKYSKAMTELKATWETEETIQRVSQELLVKYWVKMTMSPDTSELQKKNAKNGPDFHKKLLNWSREPFVSNKAVPMTNHRHSDGFSATNKRHMLSSDGINDNALCEGATKRRMIVSELSNMSYETENEYEAGKDIETKQVSSPEMTLGLNEKLAQHFLLPKIPGTSKCLIQRKKEGNENIITVTRCVDNLGQLEESASLEPLPVIEESSLKKVVVAVAEASCQTDEELELFGKRQRLCPSENEDNSKKSSDKPATDDEKEGTEEEEDDMVDIEYEVKTIVDYRSGEGPNSDEYYIKWKGFSAEYDSWEPYSNLAGCYTALIQFYTSRLGERKELEAKHVKNWNQRVNEKPLALPKMPPIPEFVMTLLSSAAPVTDADIESAYRTSLTAPKTSRWTAFKLRQVLLDVFDRSQSSNSGKRELLSLRLQILMLEGERRKELILKDLKEWETKLNEISVCKPEIVVENNYDLAGPPKDFQYINDYVIGENVHFVAETFEGCVCIGSCLKDKSQCCAGKYGKRLAYNQFRRIRVEAGYPIYECNKRCKCGPKCGNRVVQDGTVSLLGTKLCIFRTSNERGWGVKTLKKIKRGTYVCLYAGEIITSEEAECRGEVYEKQLGASYLFDLDYNADDHDGDSPYTIDATQMGNISHFINHSCDPNLCVFNVWADCVDQNLPKLAFFTLRDINIGEELTYDYGTNDTHDSTATPEKTLATAPMLSPNEEPGPDDMMAQIDPALLSTLPAAKNRMKPATGFTARRPCLCGSTNCRKVLF